MKPSLRQRTRLLAHLRRAYRQSGDKRTRAQYGRMIATLHANHRPPKATTAL